MYYFTKIEPKYYESIKDYRREMLEHNSSFDGCNQLQDYEDIEKWDYNVQLFESDLTCPPGYSLSYQYLYCKDKQVIGMINVRTNYNNPYIKMYGGQIGYSIKPSYRNKGIGKKMLKEFLVICREKYKLNKIMITCFKDNIGSKKIIEDNGGILMDEIIYPPENRMLLRFWIS